MSFKQCPGCFLYQPTDICQNCGIALTPQGQKEIKYKKYTVELDGYLELSGHFGNMGFPSIPLINLMLAAASRIEKKLLRG